MNFVKLSQVIAGELMTRDILVNLDTVRWFKQRTEDGIPTITELCFGENKDEYYLITVKDTPDEILQQMNALEKRRRGNLE